MKVNLYEEIESEPIGSVEYVDHMGDDITIVNSARVSFGKHKQDLDQQDLKLIKYLVKHRHTSVFEHNVITFRFKVPLFIRSQHMRHRTWSYNEISRRYTDFNIEFYNPNKFRTQHLSNRQASNLEHNNPMIYGTTASKFVEDHAQASLEAFNELTSLGICREQARMVLPQNMYTEYYGTTNLNNLLKFIDLRTHMGAQWEIQKVAEACLEIATDLWPITVTSYRELRGAA